jgi:hypothetical protein
MDINFYTFATGRYKHFAIPYLVSSLLNNKDSFVELVVDDKNFFGQKVLDFVYANFRDRYSIKKIPKNFYPWLSQGKYIKSVRWVTIPNIEAKYTYIGDVDILMLDKNISSGHARHAESIGRPYSNIVRNHPTKRKMSGLHFVVTKPYYKVLNQTELNKIISNINSGNIKKQMLDECLLYTIVKEYLGLPKNSNLKDGYGLEYRPTHGIHMSLPRRLTGWGVTESVFSSFKILDKEPIWKDAKKVFSKEYMSVLNTVPLACSLHKELEEIKSLYRNEKTAEKDKVSIMQRILRIESTKYV